MSKHRHSNRPQRTQVAKKVGLPRFRRDQWPRWIAAAADRDRWEATFDEWEQSAAATADRLTRAQLEIVWVEIDFDEFAAWCQARDYANDGEARNRFAAERIGNMPVPATPDS